MLEYIWIDGFGNPRSKTKVLSTPLQGTDCLNQIPEWNYDGSSTGQASGNDSEVIIRPVAMYNDPFRRIGHYLVLCETYLPNGEPHPSNTRHSAVKILETHPELEPMFGIEQEFFLTEGGRPLGFPQDINQYPAPQQNYYCGSGGNNAFGRKCIEKAFSNCLRAGLPLTGLNAEVAPGQWEFQVCSTGISAADHLYIMRYILSRTTETYGWDVDFHPKPIQGDWNGSGCHTNFSTRPMREEGGYPVILEAIQKLSQKHSYHMLHYGADNELRMTGKHETADYNTFTYGVANRGASVRIPRETERTQRGYFEDRRPASNMDPYLVTSLIYQTTSLTSSE